MNIGYEQIKNIIYEQLKDANANIPIGRNKFSKDLAKRIYGLIEGDVNKEWNLAHDFPVELESFVRRLEKGLKIGKLKRTDKAAEVYRWMIEQEKGGKDLKVFFAWATSEEQYKYVSKYFSNPEWLQVDFERAYSRTKATVTDNGDGSLYV